jgi:hypothetical protein
MTRQFPRHDVRSQRGEVSGHPSRVSVTRRFGWKHTHVWYSRSNFGTMSSMTADTTSARGIGRLGIPVLALIWRSLVHAQNGYGRSRPRSSRERTRARAVASFMAVPWALHMSFYVVVPTCCGVVVAVVSPLSGCELPVWCGRFVDSAPVAHQGHARSVTCNNSSVACGTVGLPSDSSLIIDVRSC